MINGMALLRFQVGKEKQAVDAIKGIMGVKDIRMVFGGWDAVVFIEADSLRELADVVVDRIRSVDGVVQTETLVETGQV